MRAEQIQRLRRMLDDRRSRRLGGSRRFVPTGLAPLDEALPHGGLPAGAITEIFSTIDGGGTTTLALRIAHAAAQTRRPVLVVDTRGDFYPPAAWRLGIAPNMLLVIRTRRIEQALWVMDQALRCLAVAAVVAPIHQLDQTASRRLQLAAESAGTIGLLLRPAARRGRSFAALQMLVEPFVHNLTRLCRVTLLKVREGMPVEPFVIGLGHETGDVPLLPAPVDRPAAIEHRRVSA